jgi:Flp pilus assembly protein TadD
MTIMLFDWLKAQDAVEAGYALADRYRQRAAPGESGREFLKRAVRDLQSLKLNFYKRARLANAFRWRLQENGVEADDAAELTQTLVLQALVPPAASVSGTDAARTSQALPVKRKAAEELFRQAEECHARADHSAAIKHYQACLALRPRDADALNNLGVSLINVGRYEEAHDAFRKAISRRPHYPEAHANLGAVHLARGQFRDAENCLRRALNSKPTDLQARSNLGVTLVLLGRLDEAGQELDKVLRVEPRHADTLYGLGMLARTEGRFEAAEDLFKRALMANPRMARGWSALAGLRKMDPAEQVWLRRAQQTADTLSSPAEEAGVRFAIGKYFDDLGDCGEAFKSYRRANELLKSIAAPYERGVRTQFVDDMLNVYEPGTLAQAGSGSSTSSKPILVVGMMRSGTSLVEQILASHPAVGGAGELEFWNDVMRRHEAQVRQGLLPEQDRKKLADEYLRTLTRSCPDAQYVVDKAPVNSDYLGVVHSVFPQARIIYMRRDPIDTCLSCYFQPFSVALNFSLDLADLAHYYTEHARLMSHWRKVLPPGTILEVPYEELVAKQELWTRKILDFLGLDWDERCLRFHTTQRPVVTSSYWQVRQPLYRDSVQRWRKYAKFIAPLRDLKPA